MQSWDAKARLAWSSGMSCEPWTGVWLHLYGEDEKGDTAHLGSTIAVVELVAQMGGVSTGGGRLRLSPGIFCIRFCLHPQNQGSVLLIIDLDV